MIRPTEVRVTRLPLEHCPTDSPRLIAADAHWNPPAGGPFTKAPSDFAPSDLPLVLWIRVVELDTPDQLTLREMRTSTTECSLELLHMDFEGILGANVRQCGAIEMQLQSLTEGAYAVTLTVSRVGFADLDHPDENEPRETVTKHLAFSVG